MCTEIPLTDRVYIVLILAKEAAQFEGSASIEPHHILTGLINEGSGIAANVLNDAHIEARSPSAFTVPEDWDGSERMIRNGMDVRQELPENSKLLFACAVQEAQSFWKKYPRPDGIYCLGTEHLLWAFCVDEKTEPGRLLKAELSKVSLTLHDIRQRVLDILGYE